MNIAVVGTGYVGLVVGTCLAQLGNKVTCVDIDKERIKKLKKGILPFHEPDLPSLVAKNRKKRRLFFDTLLTRVLPKVKIIFITVGTPSKKDGRVDLRYIREAAQGIGKNIKDYRIIVNKSTVPVGTGKMVRRIIEKYYKGNFDVVSNPEFLKEGSAIKDFLKPDRIVLGVESHEAKEIMLELFEQIKCPKLVCDLKTAEMIKYASNAFLATKISFINEIANVCEKVGADVEKVALGMGLDKRITKYFLRAGIGWGGSCFPKDVRALDQMAGAQGYKFRLLRGTIEVNIRQRMRFVRKIQSLLKGLGGKDIAVFGLAFKANTDDIRESASIDIIKILQLKGARIAAHDPEAIENAKKVLDKKIEFFEDPYKAVESSDCLVIATEWPQFKELDYKKIKGLMHKPLIADGRNFLDSEKMKKLGFKYVGVGRST